MAMLWTRDRIKLFHSVYTVAARLLEWMKTVN